MPTAPPLPTSAAGTRNSRRPQATTAAAAVSAPTATGWQINSPIRPLGRTVHVSPEWLVAEFQHSNPYAGEQQLEHRPHQQGQSPKYVDSVG